MTNIFSPIITRNNVTKKQLTNPRQVEGKERKGKERVTGILRIVSFFIFFQSRSDIACVMRQL